MAEEMRIHVELEAEHLMRTESLGAEEARRRALVAFGGVERARERSRDVQRLRWLEELVHDGRIGARSMLRVPGFSMVALLTLALGIGATTATFSVVRGVLLDPLPYPAADRLVAVWSRFVPESGFDFPQFPLSPPEYFDYRGQSEAMADVAAHHGYRATLLDDDGGALAVRAAATTWNLFALLRVQPQLGRGYSAAEDVADGAAVAVLGHALWQRAFGGERSVIGRTISVNGRTTEVIGVMPPGFAYPTPETELWTPIGLDPAQHTARGSHYLTATARLRDDADMERAHREMSALMAQWAAEYPDVHRGHFLYLRPLLHDVVGSARPALLVLLGAVGLVLLIACANVANLLLARGEVRRRELALRSALGAGRARLTRQFLAEAAVLSVAGAAAGVVLAYVLLGMTLTLGAGSIPRAENVAVDARILLFAAGIVVFTTVVFALAPLTRVPAATPRAALGEDGRSTSSARGLTLRTLLVTTQVALAVVVVIGAALMRRSFSELTAVDPGFRADGVIFAELSLPAGAYPAAEDVIAFHVELRERLATVPGVDAVAATSTLPLGGSASNIDFRVEGAPAPAPGEPAQSGDLIVTGPGYDATFGIRLFDGRFFDARDRSGTLPVVVVNRRLARMFWPGESALGKRLRVASDPDSPWLQVVGVVDDVQYRALDEEMRPAWYVPFTQMTASLGQPARSWRVAVRATGDPLVIARAFRNTLHEVDALLPIIRMRPLEGVVTESVARERLIMTVLGVFATLALVLGTIGIYGVLAYSVAQRTREFGIRIALGARPRELTALVLGAGLRMATFGIALGLAAALIATQLIRGLLFRVSPTDPVTFGAVAAAVFVIALFASLVPLWRALRADPVRALRAD